MEAGVHTLFGDSKFSLFLLTMWVAGTIYIMWQLLMLLYDQCKECTEQGFSTRWPRALRRICGQKDTEATFLSNMIRLWFTVLIYVPFYLIILAAWPLAFSLLIFLLYVPYFDALIYFISTAFALKYVYDAVHKAMKRSPFEAIPDAAREIWFYIKLVFYFVVSKGKKIIKRKKV